ncbi:hypothetical protein [Corynebacterium mastitidis]|uniref:hypothetical protein n=1 Tax=Corynebacterium mastitidis TaxID=161890 RepID=UPI00035F46B9|nr:hypothetical protein [Corynebacterium mastitidis]
MRVVKPARVQDPYAPKKASRITLDLEKGAEILPEVWLVECQPISLIEETENNTRVAAATAWRIISRRGQQITTIGPEDGVIVEGIEGVLAVEGEVGQWRTPTRLAHTELTVRRWRG